MSISYSDFMQARASSNPAVYGLSLAALRAGAAANGGDLPSAEGTRAYLTVSNIIAGLNPGRAESLQGDTDRVWDSLSRSTRRAIAINPELATPFVMEAVRSDPVLARPGRRNGPLRPSDDGCGRRRAGRPSAGLA